MKHNVAFIVKIQLALIKIANVYKHVDSFCFIAYIHFYRLSKMANAEISTTMDETNTQSIFVGVVITVVIAFLIIKIIMKSAPRIILYAAAFLISTMIKRRGIHFRLPRNRTGKHVFVGFF